MLAPDMRDAPEAKPGRRARKIGTGASPREANMHGFRYGRTLAVIAGAVILALGATAHAADRQFFSWGSFTSGTSQYVYVGTVIGLARPHLPDISLTNEATGGTAHGLE